jgi:hypothetical protein
MKQQSWSLLVVVLTYIKYFINKEQKKENHNNNFNYKIQIKKEERFIYNKGTILYNIST